MGVLYLKILNVEIKGANSSEAAILLSALDDARVNCANSNSIDISFSYKDDDPVTISVTESTPFSRYIQSTTLEGRT